MQLKLKKSAKGLYVETMTEADLYLLNLDPDSGFLVNLTFRIMIFLRKKNYFRFFSSKLQHIFILMSSWRTPKLQGKSLALQREYPEL
jgi:hypothetical protein